MNRQFLKDRADTYTLYVYENNLKIVPSAATIVIYKPGSDTELLATTVMAIATDGLLSYDLGTARTATLGLNYKVVVSYTYSGIVYPDNLDFFDIVRARLFSVISDQDVVDELPQLKDNGWRTSGQSESGSATTMVDKDLKRYPDDHFTGGLIYSITQNETRKIDDFASSTGTLTFVAFTADAGTDKYVLTQAYTREVRTAFEKVMERLDSDGRRPHLILDSKDLRRFHTYQAVAEICKGMMSVSEDTIWQYFYERYDIDEQGSKAYHAYKNLNLKYDTSDDAIISEAEEHQRMRRTIERG